MLLHNTTTKNIKNDLMQFIILSDNDFFKRYYSLIDIELNYIIYYNPSIKFNQQLLNYIKRFVLLRYELINKYHLLNSIQINNIIDIMRYYDSKLYQLYKNKPEQYKKYKNLDIQTLINGYSITIKNHNIYSIFNNSYIKFIKPITIQYLNKSHNTYYGGADKEEDIIENISTFDKSNIIAKKTGIRNSIKELLQNNNIISKFIEKLDHNIFQFHPELKQPITDELSNNLDFYTDDLRDFYNKSDSEQLIQGYKIISICQKFILLKDELIKYYFNDKTKTLEEIKQSLTPEQTTFIHSLIEVFRAYEYCYCLMMQLNDQIKGQSLNIEQKICPVYFTQNNDKYYWKYPTKPLFYIDKEERQNINNFQISSVIPADKNLIINITREQSNVINDLKYYDEFTFNKYFKLVDNLDEITKNITKDILNNIVDDCYKNGSNKKLDNPDNSNIKTFNDKFRECYSNIFKEIDNPLLDKDTEKENFYKEAIRTLFVYYLEKIEISIDNKIIFLSDIENITNIIPSTDINFNNVFYRPEHLEINECILKDEFKLTRVLNYIQIQSLLNYYTSKFNPFTLNSTLIPYGLNAFIYKIVGGAINNVSMYNDLSINSSYIDFILNGYGISYNPINVKHINYINYMYSLTNSFLSNKDSIYLELLKDPDIIIFYFQRNIGYKNSQRMNKIYNTVIPDLYDKYFDIDSSTKKKQNYILNKTIQVNGDFYMPLNLFKSISEIHNQQLLEYQTNIINDCIYDKFTTESIIYLNTDLSDNVVTNIPTYWLTTECKCDFLPDSNNKDKTIPTKSFDKLIGYDSKTPDKIIDNPISYNGLFIHTQSDDYIINNFIEHIEYLCDILINIIDFCKYSQNTLKDIFVIENIHTSFNKNIFYFQNILKILYYIDNIFRLKRKLLYDHSKQSTETYNLDTILNKILSTSLDIFVPQYINYINVIKILIYDIQFIAIQPKIDELNNLLKNIEYQNTNKYPDDLTKYINQLIDIYNELLIQPINNIFILNNPIINNYFMIIVNNILNSINKNIRLLKHIYPDIIENKKYLQILPDEQINIYTNEFSKKSIVLIHNNINYLIKVLIGELELPLTDIDIQFNKLKLETINNLQIKGLLNIPDIYMPEFISYGNSSDIDSAIYSILQLDFIKEGFNNGEFIKSIANNHLLNLNNSTIIIIMRLIYNSLHNKYLDTKELLFNISQYLDKKYTQFTNKPIRTNSILKYYMMILYQIYNEMNHEKDIDIKVLNIINTQQNIAISTPLFNIQQIIVNSTINNAPKLLLLTIPRRFRPDCSKLNFNYIIHINNVMYTIKQIITYHFDGDQYTVYNFLHDKNYNFIIYEYSDIDGKSIITDYLNILNDCQKNAELIVYEKVKCYNEIDIKINKK